MICWSWVAAAFIPVMWRFTEYLLLHPTSAGSCWTKVPNLSSWVKLSEVLSYSFGVKAVKTKSTKPLPTGIYTMPQLWPGLHKLRKSTLEVFPYQTNSGPSTTNHRVEQNVMETQTSKNWGLGMESAQGIDTQFSLWAQEQDFPSHPCHKDDFLNTFGQVTSLLNFCLLS